ncbi:FadR/GntR family transcriptional regulator [Microlunatus sp. GCM10028923]|uniref:FadR/GntR family transcriptional regulator n=1 Tax=Microlunatus sp. GCM10028923 TaxID=3273400 RepID=UPI003614E674
MAEQTLSATAPARRTPNRLVPTVTAELVRSIVRGEFPPGALLSRETDLSERFRVSRTVVRESIKVLEEKGLVSVQQGRGTTVQPRIRWNLFDPIVISACQEYDADFESSAKLVVVRAAVESEMTRQAAERFTAGNAVQLGRMLAAFDGIGDDGPAFLQADRALHEFIVDLSGNEFASALSRSTHAWVVQPAQLTNERLVTTIHDALAEHEAICAALCANDGEAAAAAMRAHILDSWRRTYSLLSSEG